MLLLLLACKDPTTPEDSGDAATDDTTTTTETGTLPDTASDVPMVDEVLADECGDYTPASGVGSGDDLHKVTLPGPNAVCNDGTAAVIFVRPSSGGEYANRWLFYLQGGSNCGDADECKVRYCGDQKYTKAKMSSNWTPEVANTDGQGVLDRNGVNPLGEANTVLFYYCSSDSWQGQNDDAVLQSETDPDLRYRLHFRGHDIVTTALEQLFDAPVTSDDGEVEMPMLSDASLVVWTGSSAGALGAEAHADYVTDMLAPQGAEVYAVFDANLPIEVADMPAEYQDDFTTYLRDENYGVRAKTTYESFLDESCLAYHPDDEDWMCASQTHIVLNHITTPFFARQDLLDPVVGAAYFDLGATDDEIASAWRNTVLRVPELATTAEEADEITRTPGIYAPNCGQHVALTEADWYGKATVVDTSGHDTSGTAWTFAMAAITWGLGDDVAVVDTQPTTTSDCEAVNDGGG